MRLLNSKTLEFEEFASNEIPPYAILSHTWGREEVPFADFGKIEAQGKEGYQKVKYMCRQASQDNLQYAWIDTCCIDKSSSSELSEAINSMYAWYADAEVCYAYLPDVAGQPNTHDAGTDFARSRWFTRGWTLQELLAPKKVVFYTAGWNRIGERSEQIKVGERLASIASLLSTITGIDEDILTGARSLHTTSVAKRMSWAATRTTTRIEDVAYCLLGIFSVNMPLLYGEGARAFIRLQEEIIKISDDETLFAWTNPQAPPELEHGLLATAPASFADSGSFIPFADPRPSIPYAMTNQGLRISPYIVKLSGSMTVYVAALNCPGENGVSSLALYLRKVSAGRHYARVQCAELTNLDVQYVPEEEIRVRQVQSAVISQRFDEIDALNVEKLPRVEHGYKIVSIFSSEECIPHKLASLSRESDQQDSNYRYAPQYLFPKTPRELVCAILFDSHEPEMILIALGSLDTQVGFSAVGVPKAVSTVAEAWTPDCISFYPPGIPVHLEHHQVNVQVSTKIINRHKCAFVDIDIRAIQHEQPNTQVGLTRITLPENSSSESLGPPESPTENHHSSTENPVSEHDSPPEDTISEQQV